MSVIEKLDEAIRLLHDTESDWGEFSSAAIDLLRDHGPAIRQDMIDAERYAWLRENLGQTVSHWFCTEGGCALDAAIDKARATGEGEGNG